MSRFAYETAKNNVSTFLSGHFSTIKKALEVSIFDGHLTTVISDVNGTLTDPLVGEDLDQFMCDWHDAGLPAAIMTGIVDQNLPFDIAKRLESSERKWFYKKPISLKDDLRAGLAFDDDANSVIAAGHTGIDITSPTANDFLKSWSQLSPEDKAAQLKPFVDFHKHAYPSPTVETWTDPKVEEIFEAMERLFDIDPIALVELKWTIEGQQPQVYEEYVAALQDAGLMNANGTVPTLVQALVRDCVQQDEQTLAWSLHSPEPGITVMHMHSPPDDENDKPSGGTTQG